MLPHVLFEAIVDASLHTVNKERVALIVPSMKCLSGIQLKVMNNRNVIVIDASQKEDCMRQTAGVDLSSIYVWHDCDDFAVDYTRTRLRSRCGSVLSTHYYKA